ncbi:MAG: hypothetical protein Q4F95_15585 [Oscillospiraceae bacterium]|nr:hypothetical protein [Oscillospiraceae bacterium]
MKKDSDYIKNINHDEIFLRTNKKTDLYLENNAQEITLSPAETTAFSARFDTDHKVSAIFIVFSVLISLIIVLYTFGCSMAAGITAVIVLGLFDLSITAKYKKKQIQQKERKPVNFKYKAWILNFDSKCYTYNNEGDKCHFVFNEDFYFYISQYQYEMIDSQSKLCVIIPENDDQKLYLMILPQEANIKR